MRACEAGSFDVAKLLIDNGVYVKATDKVRIDYIASYIESIP